MSHRNDIGSTLAKLWAHADSYRMERARGGREIWRLATLTIALTSSLMLAIPAQAGLGDLLDQILDPVTEVPVVGDIVDPIVGGVGDPIVDDVVDPVGGGLLDPIADQVLAPVLSPVIDTVVNTVVPPVVEPAIEPVVEPVIGSVPAVGTTTTTSPVDMAREEAIARASAEFDLLHPRYESEVLVATPSIDTAVSAARVTTERRSLEAALSVQAALVDRGSLSLVHQVAGPPAAVPLVEVGWLDGLTNWLRTSTGGIFDLLALPIRLLELLARALLTAGSGLIAPLSMLLAFTAFLIKDRGWSRAQA